MSALGAPPLLPVQAELRETRQESRRAMVNGQGSCSFACLPREAVSCAYADRPLSRAEVDLSPNLGPRHGSRAGNSGAGSSVPVRVSFVIAPAGSR